MTTTSKGAHAGVTIHTIRTGSVRIRANQVRGKGHGPFRLLRTVTGIAWSDWLPIFAWVIEHPEGLIVVDTGETARVSESGYFPAWHPFFRRGLEARVTSADEIGPQLEDRGLDPRQARWVVLTHLHTDHAGGLHHFPNSEILIDPREYTAASGMGGRLRGYLPNRWPAWLCPTFIDFAPVPVGPFEQSMPLTAGGDIVIVPTPGHTVGHVSVVVRTDEVTYFLAGDTSYTEALMLEGHVDGVAPDEDTARDTLRRLRRLAELERLVYLPAHDPASANRLLARRPVTRERGRDLLRDTRSAEPAFVRTNKSGT